MLYQVTVESRESISHIRDERQYELSSNKIAQTLCLFLRYVQKWIFGKRLAERIIKKPILLYGTKYIQSSHHLNSRDVRLTHRMSGVVNWYFNYLGDE